MHKSTKKIKSMADLAMSAMKLAIGDVIEERRRSGMPLLVWKNGRVTKIVVKK